jgi:chemotaxis methyl-accepting protein methylase
MTTVSWDPATLDRKRPTLEAIRGYALHVAKDLDPGSRYILELLAALDASTSVEDYLRRLHDPAATARFREDGTIASRGERGFSWVDDATWRAMDPFEQTLSNLLTGETRMMWAGDGKADFSRLPDALRHVAPRRAAQVLSIPCSTGKEPFSVVIAALRADLEVEVTGVDRQAAYVERARSGRLVPHHRDWDTSDAARWLVKERDGSTRVSDELSRRCRFEQGDVLTGALPAGPFDLVLCRNLLGYFRGPSLEAAVTNVSARVRPGGLLLTDPFVCDGQEMALAREVLARRGFTRRWPEVSYFDAGQA